MLKLGGIPLGVERRIIGKISYDPTLVNEAQDSILVTSFLDQNSKRFRAILTSSRINLGKNELGIPVIHSIKNIEALSKGDVVSLDMATGIILVEYQKHSLHNSIIATNRCNCKCIMCPQQISDDSQESLKNNLEIVQLMDKATIALGITGGEPTLLGSDLIKLLQQCKKCLPNTQIQVLTNGILLKNKEHVRRISHLGIDNLIFCIPLYGDTDKEHDYVMQRRGAFEDTIQGIYTLAANHQRIEIRTVAMSLNYKRLAQISNFIYINMPFVEHVAFMGMEVEERAAINLRKLWASPKEYSAYLREAILCLYQRDMQTSIYNEQLCLLPKDIWPFAKKSISEWKNTYLNKCSYCAEKHNCGGLFATPSLEHTKLIHPI